MKLMRFVSEKGEVLMGVYEPGRTGKARLVEGDLLGEWRLTDRFPDRSPSAAGGPSQHPLYRTELSRPCRGNENTAYRRCRSCSSRPRPP